MVGTLLNENGGGTNNTVERAGYNSSAIAAVGGGTVDAVADYAGITLMQPAATPYFADGIHPTPLGYRLCAPVCAASINSLL